MGEALITSRTGAFGGGTSGRSGELKTEIITENSYFLVPKAKNQSFSVRIFGGGGSGGVGTSGGGGGYMNNSILTLNEGESIYVTIGEGGKRNYDSETTFCYTTTSSNYIAAFLTNKYIQGNENRLNSGVSGGSTFFGNYLSANGGSGGGRYGGGSGGGGDYSGISYALTGFQFGGGGCISGNNRRGGWSCGGKWGGGGGFYRTINLSNTGLGGCLYENSQDIYEITGYSGLAGIGGGNNQVSGNKNGNNGTDISNIDNINSLFETKGLGGIGNTYYGGGGGGYGGCGGSNAGGGGGYGANGGNNAGGGGGYGKYGKGGDNFGGGGAYGPGGDGVYNSNSYSLTRDGKYGGGGGCGQAQTIAGLRVFNNEYQFPGNGGDGICIIQYYPE